MNGGERRKMTEKTSKRKFLNEEKISYHLKCSICLQVFQDPVRTACGHTFCYICIQEAFTRTRKCPFCSSKAIRSRKFEKDFIALNLIDELLTACSHPGCQWVGIYSLLKKHQRFCQFRPQNYKFIDSQAAIDLEQTCMEIQQSEQDQSFFMIN